MRDAMLFASGELDTTMGGRPIDLSAQPAIPRRSVYGFINRDIVSNLASTFDGPNPSSCTVERAETIVPQQALFALNSEFIQDRARALAAREEVAQAKSDAGRVSALYQCAFSRLPDEEEMRIALQYIHGSSGEGNSRGRPWELLAHVLLATNELVYVD